MVPVDPRTALHNVIPESDLTGCCLELEVTIKGKETRQPHTFKLLPSAFQLVFRKLVPLQDDQLVE